MHEIEESTSEMAFKDYKITVLLVDDQLIIGEAVKRQLLEEKDIDFNFCQNPEIAVAEAVRISPTVILQDLIMPEVDGLTLVKFYRAHPDLKDIPVIVLSSKEEAMVKAELFASGANDYLVKLPDRIELIARIRYHSKGYINLLQRNEAYNKLKINQQELASELDKAANYVVSLLPPKIKTGSIQTEWDYIPSAQLGGDSFGYHWIDENHFAMYLLDVCGHGVGSALLSVSALNAIRTHTLPISDFREPDQVVGALNESFQMENHNDMYFTLWYGVYNKINKEIKYISAGHPPAFLFTSRGESTELMNDNFIVGGFPYFPYHYSIQQVPDNSSLFIFSDGVYEITKPEGDMWTIPELKEFLLNTKPDEQSEITKLYKYIQELSSRTVLDDDFSMVKISFYE